MEKLAATCGVIVMLAAAGIVGCTSGIPAKQAETQTASVPRHTEPSYLACSAEAAGLGKATLPQDRIQLMIIGVSHTQRSTTAEYEVSSTVAGQGVGFPIEPIPPTLLLIHRGAIAGVQASGLPPLPPGTVDARDPYLRKLPYRDRLTLAGLCPGQSWAAVRQNPGSYQVAIVMTRQFAGPVPPPPAHFLSESSTPL